MTYDTVATFSQVASLLLFVLLFLGVLAYVLWPSTRDKLERAQKRALDLEDTGADNGGQRIK